MPGYLYRLLIDDDYSVAYSLITCVQNVQATCLLNN